MLTDKEKDILFEMIQNRIITAERNNELRGNDEAAKAEIASYCQKNIDTINSQIEILNLQKEKYL